jgi:hypothetical protein
MSDNPEFSTTENPEVRLVSTSLGQSASSVPTLPTVHAGDADSNGKCNREGRIYIRKNPQCTINRKDKDALSFFQESDIDACDTNFSEYSPRDHKITVVDDESLNQEPIALAVNNLHIDIDVQYLEAEIPSGTPYLGDQFRKDHHDFTCRDTNGLKEIFLPENLRRFSGMITDIGLINPFVRSNVRSRFSSYGHGRVQFLLHVKYLKTYIKSMYPTTKSWYMQFRRLVSDFLSEKYSGKIKFFLRATTVMGKNVRTGSRMDDNTKAQKTPTEKWHFGEDHYSATI